MRLGKLGMLVILWSAWCWGDVPQQAVIFNNFGPNNTHANYGTWMGSGFSEVMYSATAFTPTASGTITQFQASMWTTDTDPSDNAVTFYLLTSVGALPPQTNSIWSETFTGDLSTAHLSTFPVANGPRVSAGTRYWLYVETPVTGVYSPNYNWYDGLTGSNSEAWFFAQSPTRANKWQIFDPPDDAGRSLSITATVPEPAGTLVLIPLCLIRLRRKRKWRRN